MKLLCLFALFFGPLAPSIFAADHLDSPSVTSDKSTDITDYFAWMNDDATKLNLVMNVFPLAGDDAAFSDKAQYVFWVTSQKSYGATDKTEAKIVCTFAEDQTISCWAGDDYVTGDASATEGLMSNAGTFKVFAGKRNDPFFMNFEGFTDTAKFVTDNAGSLTFNDAGCPTLDSGTSTAIVSRLQGTDDGADDAADFFAGANVMSIVIQIDKTAVNSGGDLLSTFASTHKSE